MVKFKKQWGRRRTQSIQYDCATKTCMPVISFSIWNEKRYKLIDIHL